MKIREPNERLYNLLVFVVAAIVMIVVAIVGNLCKGADIPQQPGPLNVRPSAKEIELGRKLFFDRRLSQNNTISCSSCHDPAKGWSDGRQLAVGILGQTGTRHSPTIINSSYMPLVFWDGRTVTTVPQALLPISNPIEMGDANNEVRTINKLRLIPGYVSLFADVYGIDTLSGSSVTGVNLGRAIAAFESTVVSFDAPVDAYMAGDRKALSPDAEVGFKIFEKADCMSCHKPPLFTDNLFHNNGMEFAGKFRTTDDGRFRILPANLRTNDTVRAFKTPTLREISRSAPYNHAGNFADLRRVIQHYNAGGANYQNQKDRFQDQRIKPLGLTETQFHYLEVFLKEGLQCKNYPMISEPNLP